MTDTSPMKLYFVEMFRYERWANARILAYLQAEPTRDQAMGSIFRHLVADALPWLHVLRGDGVPATVIRSMTESPHWPLDMCRTELEAFQDALDMHLETLTEADFATVLTSEGPRGSQFHNTVAEVLTHLLSHGQHHRGQIELLAEQELGDYLATSYMPYLRQRVES